MYGRRLRHSSGAVATHLGSHCKRVLLGLSDCEVLVNLDLLGPVALPLPLLGHLGRRGENKATQIEPGQEGERAKTPKGAGGGGGIFRKGTPS